MNALYDSVVMINHTLSILIKQPHVASLYLIYLMDMAKKSEKLLARELYLNTSMTQKEIADRLNVTVKTIAEWKDEGNWEALRAAKKVTKAALISNYYTILATMQTQISSRPEPDNVPTSKEADIMAKIGSQIEKIDKQSSLQDYILAFEEFLEFLLNKDPELASKIAPYQYEFLQEKALQNKG